jgi:hypothetical protein
MFIKQQKRINTPFCASVCFNVKASMQMNIVIISFLVKLISSLSVLFLQTHFEA